MRLKLLLLAYFALINAYFIHVTDVHYDPNYNCRGRPETMCNTPVDTVCIPVQNLCNSPSTLVESMISHMQSLPEPPEFIVITGDSAAHDLPSASDVLSAVSFVTKTIQLAFPGVYVYPIIGNNDLYPKNTLPDGPSKYLTEMTQMLQEAVQLPESVWATFEKGGYYSHSPSHGLRILAINSMYYDTNWEPLLTNDTADPADQFQFMEKVLEQAEADGELVIVALHQGLGAKRPAKSILWDEDYIDEFLKIVDDYRDTILVILAGHTHRDSFSLVYQDGTFDKDVVPMAIQLIPGSISPKEANNPSYRIMELSGSNLITDYTQYIFNMDTSNWEKSHSFVEETGENPTPKGYLQVYNNMEDGLWPLGESSDTGCNYLATIWTSNGTHVDEYANCWNFYCVITELYQKDLDNCADDPPSGLDVCPKDGDCNLEKK